MKKKFLSIALIAMSLVSFTGIAQNVSNASSQVKTENVKGFKGDKKDGKRDSKKFGKKNDPFANMNLSDSQRQQLEQLNAERRAERQEMKAAKKAEKQRNDSVKMAKRIADKKDYLQKVKAIVGPEQYVVFLENVYMQANPGHGQKAMVKKGHRDGKDGKKDFAKGRHGEKNNRGNKDSKKS